MLSDTGSDVEALAQAELFLCENAGPLIRELIERAEAKYGVSIHELRVTLERGHVAAGQSGVNCAIVE
jgi:hypothetical protein